MDYKEELFEIKNEIKQAEKSITDFSADANDTRSELNELAMRIDDIARKTGYEIPTTIPLQEINTNDIDLSIDVILSSISNTQQKFPKLSATDIVISSIAGIIAVSIDVFLVGTPEVVKIYKGGENFDGSTITKAIRKLGEGKLGDMCRRLEDICKIPYDIAVIKDGMYPQNHRLRSLSHDPFFGVFFAIFDILLNTTTFIDNSGFLRIIPNSTYQSSITNKVLSVFYYIGHILSDMFTARGIPIPGFFLTQFFTEGDANDSIAKIAEGMYLDGYDLRHLASMSTPVLVKRIIIDTYLKLTEKEIYVASVPLAQREKIELDKTLKKEKLSFIANSIMVSGNVAKFFAPPYSCNPCSINVTEWIEFIKNGIVMLQAQLRDYSAEEALHNRDDINAAWDKLAYSL